MFYETLVLGWFNGQWPTEKSSRKCLQWLYLHCKASSKITPLALRHELLVTEFRVTVLLGKSSCSILKVVHEYPFILALFTMMVVTDSCITQLLNCKQNNSSFDWHLGEIFGSRVSKMMGSLDISSGRQNPGA